MSYPPLVLAACLRRGVMASLLKSYQVTTDDVFLDFGEGNVVRVEISCLPSSPPTPVPGVERGAGSVKRKRPVNTRKK